MADYPPAYSSSRESSVNEDEGSETKAQEEVDGLADSVALERERCRQLEKRAAEAECIAVWLKEELDRSGVFSEGVLGTNPHLDGGIDVSTGDSALPSGNLGTAPNLHASQGVMSGGAFANAMPEAGELPTKPTLNAGDVQADRGLGTSPQVHTGTVLTKPQLQQQVGTSPQVHSSWQVGTNPQVHSGSVLTRPQLQQAVGDDVRTAPKLGGVMGDVPTNPKLGSVGTVPQLLQTNQGKGGDFSDIRALHAELGKLHQHYASKEQEVRKLSDQNLNLREELNREKQRVVELKRSENTRQAEMEKLSGDLEVNDYLQDQITLLRTEAENLKGKIQTALDNESRDTDQLNSGRPSEGEVVPEEMERLSMTVSGQLVKVERELANRTRQVSELADPFLKQAHGLLDKLRGVCTQLDRTPGGPRPAPPLFDPRSKNLKASLRTILELLHYVVEIVSSARAGGVADDRISDAMAASRMVPHLGGSPAPSAMVLNNRPLPDKRSEGGSKRWTCMLDT